MGRPRPLLPKPRLRRDRRGRPWRDPREVLNGILWILRTGAPWQGPAGSLSVLSDVPSSFQRWVRRRHASLDVLRALAADLHARGGLDLSETFIDGSFASAKKKGVHVGKTKRGKGTKIMAIADRAGLPVAITIASASPHETRLVEQTLNASFLPDNPAATDWRCRLRQRWPRPAAGRVRHRDDRPARVESGEFDAGWP